MAQARRPFEGEWWWPKLNPSRLNSPPVHISLHTDDSKHDLEKGMALPLPSPEVDEVTNHKLFSLQYEGLYEYSEEEILSSYPQRLHHHARQHATLDRFSGLTPATIDFRYLRYFSLQRLTHRLAHLADRLHSPEGLTDDCLDEMNKLLSDQGL